MDDDESSMSSKSDCVKALGSLELRNWLSHHNKSISKRYEQHEHSEKRRKQLLHGLGAEVNPEKTLGTILELAFPRVIKKNGKVANTAMSSSACNRAVEKMLYDASLHERYNSGMHPVTLLAEQRRKIVLNALTDIGYENEDKKVSQLKVSEFIEGRQNQSAVLDDGGVSYSAKLTPLPMSATNSARHHTYHHNHPVENHSHITQASPQHRIVEVRKFAPKWDHYDTMRTRWGYIQPQVRKLKEDDQLIAPHKNQKFIKVNKETIIHGNVNDIQHFESQHEKRIAKQTSTLSKTLKMETDRQEKASVYYIPNPCVRY